MKAFVVVCGSQQRFCSLFQRMSLLGHCLVLAPGVIFHLCLVWFNVSACCVCTFGSSSDVVNASDLIFPCHQNPSLAYDFAPVTASASARSFFSRRRISLADSTARCCAVCVLFFRVLTLRALGLQRCFDPSPEIFVSFPSNGFT